ncbi:2-isopropylmalate synthase [Coleofasciculus sp. FACHB-64]|uniref:2-isopropylmalate synthase n=1 Tax=Cyanophyceae TaxID=3028117 RepID=UPI001686A2E5|nr:MULTISPECIES: 2-isopropylmalate synthase [unclassified Coleofasciculus]MBD1841003.1 2-isopropylmalate synthase [Coleofasciculus sp. FACHB-501]MBD2047466.1 2-isopropylmalate synthase [Coleofasciculus sp. FACHB-64]
MAQPSLPKIIIFDTTMRDGELTPGVKMNIHQKLRLAKLLEEMRVDVIEVGYPGAIQKGFDEIFLVSQQIKQSTICGLANSKPNEVMDVALAIKLAGRGRIHIYTQVNLKHQSTWAEEQTLEAIHDSIGLARNYCADVEWSAFDAPRSQPDFLCKAIETAIKSGARTISIPDSLGLSSPIEFSGLLNMLFNRVSNIDRATISVHCHDDMGLAVENSIAAFSWGVKQIECSINGLGTRKGNADLGEVVNAIINHPNYSVDIEKSLIGRASELVAKISESVK